MNRFEISQPSLAPHIEGGGVVGLTETLDRRLAYKESIFERCSGEVKSKTFNLTEFARNEALRHTNTPEGRARVNNSIDYILKHAIAENLTIAEQLDDPSYKGQQDPDNPGFRPYILQSLEGIRIAGKVCSDDREHQFAIGDPKIAIYSRSPGGFLETALDQNGRWRITNLQHRASIRYSIGTGERQNGSAPYTGYTQYHGPHGDLENPENLEDFCAGIRIGIESQGGGIPSDFKFAGLDFWFEATEDQFNALDYEALRNGGESTTFDMVFNTHNQELVFGLRNAFLRGKIDKSRDLQSNLRDLQGEIIQTMQIAGKYKKRIRDIASLSGNTGNIDFRDYTKFGENITTIGYTGMRLALEEEQREFPFIPLELRLSHLEPGKRIGSRAIRSLGYSVMRNASYLVLTGMKTGENNPLNHHVAEMLAIGETGAHFNYLTPALIHGAPAREFGEAELDAAKKLSGVEKHTLEHLGYDPLQYARIIRATGAFDPEMYTEDAREEALMMVVERVKENADRLRRIFPKGVKDGQILVLGSIHNPRTREITHIV